MSGAIGLAIATNILDIYVRSDLPATVTSQLVTRLLQLTEAIKIVNPAT